MSSKAGGGYEAGQNIGSRSVNWRPSGSGPNTVAAHSLTTLRNRSRDAIRNDPWAKSACDIHTSEAIGTGIQPYPQHRNAETRDLLKNVWADWSAYADADGRLDIYGLQSLANRAIFSDGETLARIRPRRLTDGLPVPLQIQVVEADHLPIEKNELLSNGNEICNGIEFNKLGQITAYWLWRRHPSDARGMGIANDVAAVPASSIIHAYIVQRPGQVRGIPALASVLARLKSLDNYCDAVSFKLEVSNLFAGFVRRPMPEAPDIDPITGQELHVDWDGSPMVALEPGTMQDLLPGEDIKW